MPNPLIIGKALDVINNLFGWFSSEERRKRRKLHRDDRIKVAIDLQEKHYDVLDNFLDFVDDRINLPNKNDSNYFKTAIDRFKKDGKRFKELT